MILFGVVAAMGFTSQLLAEHYGPLQRELATLQLRINTHENSGSDSEIGPIDYKRLGELEGILGSISDVRFEEIGERLLNLSIMPIFLIAGLMILQVVGRWLWLGKIRVVKNRPGSLAP